MKKLIATVLLVAFPFVAQAGAGKVRNKNRENLNRLSVGMTKEEVLKVMGTKTLRGGGIYGTGKISNPYRTETLLSGDGKTTLEVLFYYTDKKKADGAITDDELTPLVLKEGKLIGWGWSFIDQAKQIYEIRIR